MKEEPKYDYESDDIKEEYKSDSGSDYEQPQKKKKKKATPRKTVKKEPGETKKRKRYIKNVSSLLKPYLKHSCRWKKPDEKGQKRRKT